VSCAGFVEWHHGRIICHPAIRNLILDADEIAAVVLDAAAERKNRARA
jgi:hypothetical protein